MSTVLSTDGAWRELHEAATDPYRKGGSFAWHFARGKPDLRLEPLPVAGNQVDDRDRYIKCLSGE